MNRKRTDILCGMLIGTALVILLSGCGEREPSTGEPEETAKEESTGEIQEEDINTDALTDLHMLREDVEVDLENVEEPYNFLLMADFHLGVLDEDVTQQDTVKQRMETFRVWNGKTPAENWEKLPGALNDTGADGILFAGDMLDFASPATVSTLKEGMDRLNFPCMYLRADHDMENYFCNKGLRAETDALHHQILSDDGEFPFYEEAGNENIFCWEYEEFMIVGMNFSTRQISKEALNEFITLCQKKKPIILVMHVPLNSITDSGLGESSREIFTDRNLTWGNGCYYYPDINTAAFLQLVYQDSSPVRQVLAGHLHFHWNGTVIKEVKQRVMSPLFKGYYTVLTIK